ncbi:TPA: hypothetical protein ACH3X2_002526 [Trebouxia sp. C0005]
MVSSCQCSKGAVVRGIHIRRIRQDQSLRIQDSAIAASLYVNAAPGHEPPLKSFYGIIQEIISVKVPLSDPQFFLKVKWWVGKEVTLSLMLAAHLLDDEGKLIARDEG